MVGYEYSVALPSVAGTPVAYRAAWAFPGTQYLILVGEADFAVILNTGHLLYSQTATIGLSGAVAVGSDLYVLDGPVLMKFDMSSFGAAAIPQGPTLAINVTRRGSAPFDSTKGQSWAQAKAAMFPQPGEVVPRFAEPLAIAPAATTAFAVYALGSDGIVRGLDTGFMIWALGAHGVPDELQWCVADGPDGNPYLCYPSANAVLTLQPQSQSLQNASIAMPNPLANAAAWVRSTSKATQPSPSVNLPQAGRIVIEIGTAYCDAAIANGTTQLSLYDFGTNGAPQFGQGKIPLNPPPATLPLAQLSIPGTLAGPPALEQSGSDVVAYVVVQQNGSAAFQQWRFADGVDDEPTRQTWLGLYQGTAAPQIGFMESLVGPAASTAWDPWTACGIAASCMAFGTRGAFG
jgi:hypothetical protein